AGAAVSAAARRVRGHPRAVRRVGGAPRSGEDASRQVLRQRDAVRGQAYGSEGGARAHVPHGRDAKGRRAALGDRWAAGAGDGRSGAVERQRSRSLRLFQLVERHVLRQPENYAALAPATEGAEGHPPEAELGAMRLGFSRSLIDRAIVLVLTRNDLGLELFVFHPLRPRSQPQLLVVLTLE